MKRVLVTLEKGDVLSSEDMEDAAAQAEFDRIVAESPGLGNPARLIKLGSTAAFKAGDFKHIELAEPSSAFIG